VTCSKTENCETQPSELDRQTDRQCLFILHGQPKDPEVMKISWPWVSHYMLTQL